MNAGLRRRRKPAEFRHDRIGSQRKGRGNVNPGPRRLELTRESSVEILDRHCRSRDWSARRIRYSATDRAVDGLRLSERSAATCQQRRTKQQGESGLTKK